MLKNLFKDFGVYGIAPFIPKIAGVLVLPLITPFLTREDYGVFGIITAYTGFFSILFTLGLQLNLSNSFFQARSQYKWLWRQIYGFWIMWAFVYALIISSVLWFAMPESASENALVIIALNVAPIVFFGPTAMMASYYYQFKKKPFQIGIRSAVFGVLNIILTLYFIKYMRMGYMGWFWAAFITEILTNISWWFPFNLKEKMTPIFNFKRRTIKKALKVGLPVVPHLNAMYLLNQSDRVVMDVLKVSEKNIGLYNVAYTTTNLFNQIGSAYVRSVQPYIYDLIRDKKEKALRDLFYFSQIMFFIAALFFACYAKEIFELLIRNDDLNFVYQLAVLILMSSIFKPMYMAANSRLFYFEKTKSISLYSIAGGIINVGLNFLLIPVWGYEIAAATTVLGYMFISYSRFWSKDYKETAVIEYYPMRWVILSILVCAGGYYLADLGLAIRIPSSIILIILSVYFLLKYRKKLSEIV